MDNTQALWLGRRFANDLYMLSIKSLVEAAYILIVKYDTEKVF